MKVVCKVSKYAIIWAVDKGGVYSVIDTREDSGRLEFLVYDDKGHWTWVPAAYFAPVEEG